MTIDEIIESLEVTERPDRRIDASIALLIGYRREAERNPTNGETQPVWITPTGAKSRVPYYTTLIDHAYELAQYVAPGHVGGCAWEKGKGSARILPMEACEASSPSVALCLAALKYKRANDP